MQGHPSGAFNLLWFSCCVSPITQVAMNIDAADKMPNLSVKPDGVHAKLEKYILRKVGLA